MKPLLIGLGIFLAVYIGFVLFLIAAGKSSAARAVAGFIPDCIVLFKNLLKDSRVPSRYKIIIVLLIAYLAFPIDLVPDFIPVAGQLDDAIIVALVLRAILKGAGKNVVRDNWRGPDASLQAIGKIARIEF